MFDFEKLEVYLQAKAFHKQISGLVLNLTLSTSEKDQLRRAPMSIVLNIAEGSGRFTKPDKRNFYIIARGSVFETVAILEIFHELGYIEKTTYHAFYTQAESISKMLFSLINTLSPNPESFFLLLPLLLLKLLLILALAPTQTLADSCSCSNSNSCCLLLLLLLQLLLTLALAPTLAVSPFLLQVL